MLAFDHAFGHRQGGTNYIGHVEPLQTDGSPHHVDDGIDSPDFMKMHLVKRDVMDF